MPPHRRPPTHSFHQKLEHILACATRVFSEKGYEGASIRDIARSSRVSLAGLYYYFRSKEELLFLIQKHTFTTLIENLDRDLAVGNDATEKLCCLIRNHLRYFLSHPDAMKVLAHESESLSPPFARVVADLKRSYYRICRGLLEELAAQKQLRSLNTRAAVLSLFGMMNWVYTWYNPRVDPGADELADTVATIFFDGVRGARGAQPSWIPIAKRAKGKSARTLAASTV